jgi:hypothetical protein
MLSLDYDYDGAPIMQDFSNWERVGQKVRLAREQLKAIARAVGSDAALLGKHRKALFQFADEIRARIRSSEETTFSVHGRRAGDLLNEASMAVETMSIREARAVLRSAQADLRSLHLSSSDRDMYKSAFDDLWAKLNARGEEARQRHAEWRARQEAGLERLLAARSKAEDALDRVRSNIALNEERLSSAYSSDYADRVSEWIREGEEKARDIEQSIEELDRRSVMPRNGCASDALFRLAGRMPIMDAPSLIHYHSTICQTVSGRTLRRMRSPKTLACTRSSVTLSRRSSASAARSMTYSPVLELARRRSAGSSRSTGPRWPRLNSGAVRP